MGQPYTLVLDFDSACYASGHAVDIMEAERTFDNYVNKLSDAIKPERIIGFVEAIEGKNNFRSHVAVTRPYKENRRGRERPPFTNEMKRYACSKYGMKYAYNVESEDAATITANEIGLEKCVKGCVDKDMLTAPGLFINYFGTEWKLPHYTILKNGLTLVTREQAELNLYTQILSGDSDDAIVGCKGVGVGTAVKMLEGVPIEALPHHVAGIYKERGYSYEYLLEQSRLIYILRRRGEVFTPVSRELWEAIQCD